MTNVTVDLPRRIDDQHGLTLVELVVAMAILSIVMLVFLTTLTTIQRVVVDEQTRSETANQVRLAAQSIDRQVRSGNLLYNPSAEAAPLTYFQLRIFTQSNGDPRCALWQINDSQQLVHRTWPPLTPEDATPWHVVAEGVVNRAVSPTVNAFSLSSTARTITVTFLVNDDLANEPTATQRIQASLTGRNTSFGYSSNVCDTLPTT
jgi:prepilin-type N-terminal cleavage/methylation domain-containing protein